jgi:hypothetical protein
LESIETTTGFASSSAPFETSTDPQHCSRPFAISMDLLEMDEAALLAELKAISSSARRMDDAETTLLPRAEISHANSSSPSKSSQLQLSLVQRHSPAALRRRKSPGIGMAPSDEVDSHFSSTSGSFESTPPQSSEETTLKPRRVSPVKPIEGVRGGPAEDAELLALLKNVSNQSSSASRFEDSGATPADVVVPLPQASNVLPPWKRRSAVPPVTQKKAVKVEEEDVKSFSMPSSSSNRWEENDTTEGMPDAPDTATTVAAAEPRSTTLEPPISVRTREKKDDRVVDASTTHVPSTGKMGLPFTFHGERGGTAEDAELLALLRGVSNQSSSASLFQTNDAVLEAAPPNAVAEEIVVAEPHSPPEAAPLGIPSAPSTFQGERGGAAEDAELLALLRGVSNQSSSASRFQTNDSDALPTAVGSDDFVVTTQKEPLSSSTKPEDATVAESLPPWKRRSAAVNRNKKADVVVVVTDPSSAVQEIPVFADTTEETAKLPPMGIPSISTFQGERGGAAEDAELLALLRGVSSASAHRFHDENPEPTRPSFTAAPPVTATGTAAFTSSTNVNAEGAPQVLPADEVPKSLSDKNWKVRCQAYDTLSLILCDHVKNGGQETIDSDTVMNGLDERVPSFVEDSNAGALDKALEFCILYAEHCRGAGRAEQARSIVSSLIRKNGFSSRPSTLKLSSTLALNLMQVSSDGAASVHAVVDVLIAEGLASKKPKVIQASIALIVEATYHFGAASLPLATITQAAPKMLSHSNAAVRDGCVQILAEVCRTLGSKAPILNVLEVMKKAQLMELDNQLTEQPEPTPIRTGLRSSRQPSGSNGPAATAADALAALQAGSKELEAQRFAAREAVDVVAAMARTDYANQIVLSKWSEKVAALDKVLECGGEKPYKLVLPSPTVNYGPVISDMKKLLGHTHFAVCGRAIQVLSMLAQGVGEKLYPHLRPILTPLLQLSKDKKLTSEVSNGLDVLFGNVLSFESILDEDDAIPSMVNEKLQKNTLARATALNFLKRCVKRREEAGPKGTLSPPTASKIATLCIAKLDDSDASVRKASMGVFEALLQVKDAPIGASVQKLLEQLRTSNPRAYKALSSTEADPAETVVKPRIPPPPVAINPPVRSRSAAPSKRPPSPATRASAAAEFPSVDQSMSTDDRTMPHLEEALIHITGLSIPQWDASEDDGGILSGLKGMCRCLSRVL